MITFYDESQQQLSKMIISVKLLPSDPSNCPFIILLLSHMMNFKTRLKLRLLVTRIVDHNWKDDMSCFETIPVAISLYIPCFLCPLKGVKLSVSIITMSL